MRSVAFMNVSNQMKECPSNSTRSILGTLTFYFEGVAYSSDKRTFAKRFSSMIFKRSGNKRSGNKRSGNKRSGNKRSGNKRSGNKRSGNKRSGNKRSGNKRSGNKRSGNKRSGNKCCLLCNTETATEFEIPLIQHKATTDQSPAIAGPRANIGRYHLRHLVITVQVSLSGLLVKANNRGGATKYCQHLTSLTCISLCLVDPDLLAKSYFVFWTKWHFCTLYR